MEGRGRAKQDLRVESTRASVCLFRRAISNTLCRSMRLHNYCWTEALLLQNCECCIPIMKTILCCSFSLRATSTLMNQEFVTSNLIWLGNNTLHSWGTLLQARSRSQSHQSTQRHGRHWRTPSGMESC